MRWRSAMGRLEELQKGFSAVHRRDALTDASEHRAYTLPGSHIVRSIPPLDLNTLTYLANIISVAHAHHL